MAATVYSFFPENAVVLSIFGFFYSIPCFYYIVALPQYATTGRFVLLTYNLTCLYWCVEASLFYPASHPMMMLRTDLPI